MIKVLTLLLSVFLFSSAVFAQTDTVKISFRKQLLDTICNTLSKVDTATITSADDAQKKIITSFYSNTELLLKAMQEEGVELTSQENGRKFGEAISKDLLISCSSFLKIAIKMGLLEQNKPKAPLNNSKPDPTVTKPKTVIPKTHSKG
ncbi:MAG: hypothetical protein ACM3H8_09665 [Sphingobacteriales bacterium]